MKNFKERVLGVLFEEEEKKDNPQVVHQESPKVVSSQSPNVSDSSVQDYGINTDLLDTIEKKIREADIPGPDYLELKDAAEEESLVKDEPDEGKRWRQAFRNMRVFFPQANITKSKIIGAIDHYIDIVNHENEVGLSELESVRNRDVVKELEAVNVLNKDISDLESLIAEKRREKEEKESKIRANREKYDRQESIFRKTIGHAIDMLSSDKEKINKYIND